MWFQDVDATDPGSGIVCHEVTDADVLRDLIRFGRLAVKLGRYVPVP